MQKPQSSPSKAQNLKGIVNKYTCQFDNVFLVPLACIFFVLVAVIQMRLFPFIFAV